MLGDISRAGGYPPRARLSTNEREEATVGDEKRTGRDQGWHSGSADAAAIRWTESHPDEDVDHDAPPKVPEDERSVPNRHSASAEAASLRWRERHPEEDE
jgi:hypothetical protein